MRFLKSILCIILCAIAFSATTIKVMAADALSTQLPDWGDIQLKVRQPEVQQFDSLLNILLVNRDEYQHLNDSIYHPMDQSVWIDFFLYRAQRLTSIYTQNRKVIAELKQRLSVSRNEDLSVYSNDLTLADFVANRNGCASNLRLRLIYYFMKIDFYNHKHSDPFLTDDLLEPEIADMEQFMPQSEFTYILYGLMVNASYKFIALGNMDAPSTEECVKYCQKALMFKDRFATFVSDDLHYPLCLAYYYLIDMRMVLGGSLDVDQALAYNDSIDTFLKQNQSFFGTVQGKPYCQFLMTPHKNFYARYLSNVVWQTGGWNYRDERSVDFANRAISQYEESEAQGKCPTLTLELLLKSKLYVGQITADEACRQYLEDYYTNPIDYDAITTRTINSVVVRISSLIFFIDESTMSDEEKRLRIGALARDMVNVFRSCRNSQDSNIVAMLVSAYSTYARLLKYLNTEQKVRYLQDMLVATQVQTVAHVKMVANLSCTLLTGVIKYAPQLLVGTPLVASEKVLKKTAQQETVLKYMYETAINHDFGKMTINEIVRNDFRPLTDREFAFVRIHQEKSKMFMKIDPSLDIYEDGCVGHHKWYNGKGGYPLWYDNTKSRYRIFVDILTLCDCLDAATDGLGRKYAQTKKFETLIQEFEAGAGTRYNPQLVQLLRDHQDVYDDMKFLVEKGWKKNYYDIYREFFNDKDASGIEQTVLAGSNEEHSIEDVEFIKELLKKLK